MYQAIIKDSKCQTPTCDLITETSCSKTLNTCIPLHTFINMPKTYLSLYLYANIHGIPTHNRFQNQIGFIKIESVRVGVGQWITCIAMTSGSKLVTNLVNSGQLFLTRRRKLLAFQVKNFNGSLLSSPDTSLFSPSSFSDDETEGFFDGPSFSTGLKKRFILLRSFHSSSTLINSMLCLCP